MDFRRGTACNTGHGANARERSKRADAVPGPRPGGRCRDPSEGIGDLFPGAPGKDAAMNVPVVLGGIALLAVLFVLLPVVLTALARARGLRRVRCPETDREVRVGLEARHAALAAALGKPADRIDYCSLWPQRRGCRQGCAAAAAETPAEDLWPQASI
jgi:hypothetical protein